MRVFMIGGTGLLGSEAARELLKRGHEVTTLARPPLPPGEQLPPEMTVEFGNYMELTEDELRKRLKGCDAFVFAAGIDERVEGPPPIYDLFARFNIAPLDTMLRLAREEGVRHAVVCGSYFVHADRIWPELELARWHPYIRSRVDQEAMALSHASPDFSVAVLELPYIFGTQPGRKPVWTFLVEAIRNMRGATFYPRGGTTMVTVRQVAQAMAGALERTEGGKAYPIGYDQLTWRELLTHIHSHMGLTGRRIVTVPTWAFALAARGIRRGQIKAGHEGGLNLLKFPALQTRELFIDKSLGCEPLGVDPDDIAAAIGDSIRLCIRVLDGEVETIGMRAD